jgi:hypothetical protein
MAKKTTQFAAQESSGGISRTWDKTHGLYIAGRAYADEADHTASQMEIKWGMGRLRLLVGPELREKFDRQRFLFNQAIWHGDLEEVRTQSMRMVKAWLALDKAAEAAGATKSNPRFVETVLADGTVAVIVPDDTPAEAVGGDDGRRRVIYTASEISRLLDGYPALAAIKHQFPGATVTAVRSPGDPLDAFSTSKPGLDAPFEEDSVDDLFGI